MQVVSQRNGGGPSIVYPELTWVICATVTACFQGTRIFRLERA